MIRRSLLMLSLAALAAGMVATTPAEAAKRKVPRGFFGSVMPPEMSDTSTVSTKALNGQFALMAKSGVESLRVGVSWPEVEPADNVFNFASFDRTVAAAARHRIDLIANVLSTAQWASSRPDVPFWWRYEPRDNKLFGDFMTAMVGRYGPKGTFWKLNPRIPKHPIRVWQLFNEQMADFFWATRPWPRSYTRTLKAGYRAVHKADRRATVIAGSLVAVSGTSQWTAARQLYKAGARRYFDALAIHPFTNNEGSVAGTIDNMEQIIRRVRAIMNRNHDRKKGIFLTEFTWPAALGKVPRSRLLGLETTPRGQRIRMKAGYKALVKDRRKLGVTHVLWYTWATQYNPRSPQGDVSYRFTGLTKIKGGKFSRMPILRTYTQLARKYQGCRKRASGRCG
jgi:hypothetical protein